MTSLEQVRDQLKTGIAGAANLKSELEDHIAAQQAVLAVVEAEIARPPTLDDVRAVLDKIAVLSAHT